MTHLVTLRSAVCTALVLLLGTANLLSQTPYVSRYEEDSLYTMVEISRLISEDRDGHGPVIRSLALHYKHERYPKLGAFGSCGS